MEIRVQIVPDSYLASSLGEQLTSFEKLFPSGPGVRKSSDWGTWKRDSQDASITVMGSDCLSLTFSKQWAYCFKNPPLFPLVYGTLWHPAAATDSRLANQSRTSRRTQIFLGQLEWIRSHPLEPIWFPLEPLPDITLQVLSKMLGANAPLTQEPDSLLQLLTCSTQVLDLNHPHIPVGTGYWSSSTRDIFQSAHSPRDPCAPSRISDSPGRKKKFLCCTHKQVC